VPLPTVAPTATPTTVRPSTAPSAAPTAAPSFLSHCPRVVPKTARAAQAALAALAAPPACCEPGHFMWKPSSQWLSGGTTAGHITQLCMSCPPGKYQPAAGTQEACLRCGVGLSSTDIGSTRCN
jgi:hypothetical protein